MQLRKRYGYLRVGMMLSCLAVLPMSNWCQADALEFGIKFSAPEFVLPQFTGPYQEREASIAPEEYEKAEIMRSLLEEGKREAVLAELEKFYSIELSPAMLMLQAQIYFSLEIYDKAEATYLAVLKRMPQLVRAHSDLGQLYLVREQSEKARQHFSRAIALGSNDALIHGQLGYLNLMSYGPYSAISSYQQAIALEPENIQWQQGLLAALTQARMFEAAQALLQDMLSRRPGEPGLWLNQAVLAMHTEDHRKALASLEIALLLGDTDPRNLKTAAHLHLQLGSLDRAEALFDDSLRRSNFDMSIAQDYVSWLTQVGKWDKARQVLGAAGKGVAKLNLDEQSQYYLNLAKIESQAGDANLALVNFRRSLELNPANGDSLIALADFSAKEKKYVEAEILYIRAESVARVEKKALLGRAQLYIEMQDYQAALTQMRAAYEKFPDLTHLKDNIAIIENIIKTRNATET